MNISFRESRYDDRGLVHQKAVPLARGGRGAHHQHERLGVVAGAGHGLGFEGVEATSKSTPTDNDTATISFSTPASSGGEGTPAHDHTALLTITADGTGTPQPDRVVTVDVSDTGGGSASGGGVDYTASTQTLTFGVGSLSGATQTTSGLLAIFEDGFVEGDETINLSLGGLADGTTGQVTLAAPTIQVVTIIDNDIDLQVTKSESIDPVIAGAGAENLTYVVTVQNISPTDATGVTLSEDLTLPAGVTLASVTPSVGTFRPTTAPDGTWVLGNLTAVVASDKGRW
jgi:uncharacterized repeat protein (TIGR01451 family)